ncbi:MAG: hypothetical protein ACI4R5_01380 [Acetatifactor sp.]
MNQSDLHRNAYMLRGSLAKRGYMRFWHSFTGTAIGTGVTRTFFVEYFIINPALGGSQPILGQHPYFKKRGMKPSYVMIKAGVFPTAVTAAQANAACGITHTESDTASDVLPTDTLLEGRQLHAFYPVTSLKVAQNPLYIQVEECLCSENRIAGLVEVTKQEARHRSFMTDAGYMEWDLEVHKSIACHTGAIANPFFCALNALDSFWHGEGIRTAYSGNVILDGVTYEVTPEDSYGYADKHWGRSFNRPWLQLASCKLKSERTGKELKYSALAIDGCCPKFLCFPLKPRLALQLTYTGEDFTFGIPGSFSRAKWKAKETNKRFIWHIKAQNKNALVKISMSSKKELLLPIDYEAPDGTKAAVPLYGGGNAVGAVELYRIVPEGRQWIDTLIIENGFCEFQTP